MAALPEEIIRWYETLKMHRVNFDTLWQEIVDYIVPTKRDIIESKLPGEKKTRLIFDSTAPYGHAILSEFIQGAVFNPAIKWFSQKSQNEDINKIGDVTNWIDGVTSQMLLTMSQTNFYKSAGESVEDWTAFGNGAVLTEDVNEKREGLANLRYTALACGTYVIGEGPDGKVDKCIRWVEMPSNLAAKTFGAENLSRQVQKLAEKEPFRMVTFLHSIMPRDFVPIAKSRLTHYKDMPFASCWIERDQKTLVKEGGYRKFPVAVARWKMIAGETYARGPGEIALPDTKTVNRADEMAQLAWGRELDPPQKVKAGTVLGNINLRPGSHTLMTDINGMAPLYEGSRHDIDSLLRKDKRDSILRIFHVSEILDLLRRQSIELTATEVNARLNLLQQILGPIFGRLQFEFLATLIDVTFDNMYYHGTFPTPPAELMQGGSRNLNITYEGPLARSQRNSEILAYQSYVADIAQISQFETSITRLPNWEKLARTYAEIRGVTPIIRSEAEFSVEVEKDAQMKSMMVQLEAMKATTESMKNASPFIATLREGAGGANGTAIPAA